MTAVLRLMLPPADTVSGPTFNKVFTENENVCALLRVGVAASEVFCAITKRATPVIATTLAGAHDFLDALDVFGTAYHMASSDKFKSNIKNRPLKSLGITLLAISGGCGLVSYLDNLGFIKLSQLADKIARFVRLPGVFNMFVFNVVFSGVTAVGFTLLFVDKLRRDRVKNSQSQIISENTPFNPHKRGLRYKKRNAYFLKAIGCSLLTVGNFVTAGYLGTAAKAMNVAGDILKLSHAFHRTGTKAA